MHRKRRQSAPPRALRSRPAGSRDLAAFKKKVARASESIEDRLDCLGSEASLAERKPIPAGQVWKELGL